MSNIAVLIPCFNEALTIRKVVEDFRRAIPDASIYVYDNNSTDGTADIASAAGAVVRHVSQQGKGNVVRRMFLDIEADCYIMVDGDDTYPASDAPGMADCILHQGYDMVVGDRLSSTYFSENKRPFHNFGNSLVRLSINLLFLSDIKDIMTGYRAFSRDFVKTYPVVSKGFEIETDMSIHAIDKNLDVKNYVITYKDRPEGSESKLSTYSDGVKVLLTILRLYRLYKPLCFFGVVAFLLTILSAAFFIPVFCEFCSTGQVEHMPTLIVCGFTFMAAIHAFFAGLILENNAQKNRQDFEFRLQYIHKTNH